MPQIRAESAGFHAEKLRVRGMVANCLGNRLGRGGTFSFPDSFVSAIRIQLGLGLAASRPFTERSSDPTRVRIAFRIAAGSVLLGSLTRYLLSSSTALTTVISFSVHVVEYFNKCSRSK
jgi:hypothetical protein